MYFHFQNLNEKPYDKLGNPLKHFCLWLNKVHIEWVSLSGDLRFSFGIGDESKWGFTLGLILFTLYFHWDGHSLRDREFSIYFYNKSLWIYLWHDPMGGWWSKDKWYKKGIVIHFDDLFLGKSKYSSEVMETKNVLIPMPEGSYKATINMELCTWKRKRWFAQKLLRADIKLESPIPYMGKGENSWDCGEDGMYGLSCCANSIENAISKCVESAMESRRKYGTPERIKAILVN